MPEGIVYYWENKENGMYYIGSTNGKDKSYIGSGKYFSRAYKQNPEDFERTVIYEGNSFREVEQECLEFLDSESDENSYNLTNDCIVGGMINKNQTQKQKQTARKNNSKRIAQYSLKGNYIKTFDSIKKASNELGTSINNIVTCLKGRTKTASGYQWRYINKDFNYTIEPVESANYRRGSGWRRKVKQMDLKGNLIRTYNSIREAAKSVDRSPESVSQCLNGRSQTSAGFKWDYCN